MNTQQQNIKKVDDIHLNIFLKLRTFSMKIHISKAREHPTISICQTKDANRRHRICNFSIFHHLQIYSVDRKLRPFENIY